MKIAEIVVISGKGGTGKTTLTSSLIPYLNDVVIADCDVDAPDLDILISPKVIEKEDFFGMEKAEIDYNLCVKCGVCKNSCKFLAIDNEISINTTKCEGCSVCTVVCPTNAISMVKGKTGDLFHSESSYGEMFHARLLPGEEASGKLVAEVRKKAKKFAKENDKKVILIDGSPGVGCNVISSIIGTNIAIIVVEPTVSGIHDLKRVYELISKYPIKPYVIINKYDVSLEKTNELEKFCFENNIEIGLKIPFDKRVVKSIVNKKIPSIVEKEFFEKIGFLSFLTKLKEYIKKMGVDLND